MKRIFVILMLVFSSNTIAGHADNGNIYNLHFMSNGVVVFYSTGNRVNPPACATQANRFAINATTEGGKVQLSGLMTAQAQGKSITVIGNDSCSAYSDSETVGYFYYE